jgi:hypothetical protein
MEQYLHSPVRFYGVVFIYAWKQIYLFNFNRILVT